MPRLGGDASTNRRLVDAYANARRGPWSLVSLTVVSLLLFIVRNVLVHDYRHELRETLLERGHAEPEIEQWVPKTMEERRVHLQQEKNDLVQLQSDVVILKQQVHELQVAVYGKNETQGKKE